MEILPRIRTIKPAFWTDDDLASCSIYARMLAIGLLNFTDRDGYFNSTPMIVKANVLPYEPISIEDIEGFIQELYSIKYILLYSALDKKRYGKIRTFEKHQVIRKDAKGEKASKIRDLVISEINSMEIPGIPQESPRKFHGNSTAEGKGKEGNRKGKERKGREGSNVDASADCSLLTTTTTILVDNEDKKREAAILAGKIQLVFDHWVFTCTKSNAAVLSDARKKLITAALRDYDEQFLCQAISGCKTIPHNNGKNKNGKKYLALDLILRNNENIERFQRALSEREETEEEKLLQARINCAKIIEEF